MPALHILPVGLVDPELLRRLAAELPNRFAVPVTVEPPVPPRAHWKAGDPGRFHAPAILQDLVAEAPADGGWWLALLDGGLVGPGVRSSCGFATVGGCCAIVSLAAVDPEPRALASQDDAFRRLLVEAVHEVGHLAGLRHCSDSHCVMYFSDDAAEIGRKGPEFCSNCRQRLV